MKSISVCMAAGALAMALVSVSAQESADADINWKIRREAADELADHARPCTSSPTSTVRA